MTALAIDTWVLRFDERPWTTNTERRWHHHQRAAVVRRWRSAFALLAREAHLPRLGAVAVTVVPYLANRRGLQDVGGCLPAVKAGIDGIVDAGVLIDDSPAHLVFLTFTAPIIGEGDALELVITEAQSAR